MTDGMQGSRRLNQPNQPNQQHHWSSIARAALAALAAAACAVSVAVPAQAGWVSYGTRDCTWVGDASVGSQECENAQKGPDPAFGAKASTTQYQGYDRFRDFRGGASVTRQDMAAFLYRWAGSPAFTPSAKDKAYFADVTDATPHAKEVWWLASKGISTGWTRAGRHEFRGMGTVTRQDMAAFLHRLVGDDGSKAASSKFSDVTASTPHAEDIAWLASTNVTEGWKQADGSRVFRGMATIVRQDMAAFLKRLSGSNMYNKFYPITDWSGYLYLNGIGDAPRNLTNAVFTDVSDRTPHYEEIAWMMYYGISMGWAHQRPVGASTCPANKVGTVRVIGFGLPSRRSEFVNIGGLTECRMDGYWYPVVYHSIDEVPHFIGIPD